MELKDRLKQARAAAGLTQAELAKMAGISQPTYSELELGLSKGSSRLHRIAAALGVSAEWLVSGSTAQKVTNADRHVSLSPLSAWGDGTPLDDDEVEIPLYREVELSAGTGLAHAVEAAGRKVRFSRATMRAAGVDPNSAACATLSGNSMHPMIQDGSTVGVDRGRTSIVDGELYAVDHDGMLRVKYLYRLPGGGVRLRSENSGEHPDEIYSAEEARKIRILGWVFWWSTVRKWRGR